MFALKNSGGVFQSLSYKPRYNHWLRYGMLSGNIITLSNDLILQQFAVFIMVYQPDIVRSTIATSDDLVFDSNNIERSPWEVFGQKCSRSASLFFFQCILILILVVTSVVCLSLAKTCEETTVWVAILTSSVGCILPSPRP